MKGTRQPQSASCCLLRIRAIATPAIPPAITASPWLAICQLT